MFHCYYCKYFIQYAFMTIINHKKSHFEICGLFSYPHIWTGHANFKYIIIDSQYWYVLTERTAAEIEDQNIPFTVTLLFVKSIRDGGCGQLVNDPRDIQGGDRARVLTLRVIEVRRDRDHDVPDDRAQVSFRSYLHLCRNHWGDLFGEKRFHFALVIIRNE